MPYSYADIKKEKKNKTMQRLSYFLLIFGILLTILGSVFILPNSVGSKSLSKESFVFATTEGLLSEKTEFKIEFTNLNCEQREAYCKIIIHPILGELSSLDSAFYLLQTPFLIKNLTVGYWARDNILSQNVYGARVFNESIKALTFIAVEVPREFVDIGHPLTYSFIVENVSTQIDRSSYELIFTFNGNLDDSFRSINELNNLPHYWPRLYFEDSRRAFLHVERSTKYYYSELLPSPRSVEPWGDVGSSFFWDIKNISLQHETSVIVEATNLDSENFYESLTFLGGLSLGIGVPLIITAIFEFIKNR